MSAPFLTVVVDVRGASGTEIEATLGSIRAQTGGEVEVLRLEDGTGGEVVPGLLRGASGTFVTVLGAGSTLEPDAVATLAGAVLPESDVLYADELVLDPETDEVERLRKPLWSPERLLGHHWLGRPVLLRTALAVEAAAEPLHDAWEHDLALRVAAVARSVERVAVPLLAGPPRRPDPAEETAAVVAAHLARVGVEADVEPGAVPGTSRVRRALSADTSVAVVLACQGARGLAWGERRWFVIEAARSVLRYAGHELLEVVVVHHATLEGPVLEALLALDERVRLVAVSGFPDRPEMINRGVLTTAADLVVLMDEHTEVVSDDFLTRMLGPLTDPGVGLVAPRVLASNGMLLHAGLALHQHRIQLTHAGADRDDPGPQGLLTLAHEVSGLGGGCLALRRDTFDLVGGLREDLSVLDDVDLSFKVRHAGLRRVWVPSATLVDLVDRHRSALAHRADRAEIRSRWLAPEPDEYAPTFGAWRAEQQAQQDQPV